MCSRRKFSSTRERLKQKVFSRNDYPGQREYWQRTRAGRISWPKSTELCQISNLLYNSAISLGELWQYIMGNDRVLDGRPITRLTTEGQLGKCLCTKTFTTAKAWMTMSIQWPFVVCEIDPEEFCVPDSKVVETLNRKTLNKELDIMGSLEMVEAAWKNGRTKTEWISKNGLCLMHVLYSLLSKHFLAFLLLFVEKFQVATNH